MIEIYDKGKGKPLYYCTPKELGLDLEDVKIFRDLLRSKGIDYNKPKGKFELAPLLYKDKKVLIHKGFYFKIVGPFSEELKKEKVKRQKNMNTNKETNGVKYTLGDLKKIFRIERESLFVMTNSGKMRKNPAYANGKCYNKTGIIDVYHNTYNIMKVIHCLKNNCDYTNDMPMKTLTTMKNDTPVQQELKLEQKGHIIEDISIYSHNSNVIDCAIKFGYYQNGEMFMEVVNCLNAKNKASIKALLPEVLKGLE